MFFDWILFNRQHKGRCGYAWIAATRGVSYINKKDILDLDIGKLCDDVNRYVNSDSESPRSRFSLRLSAILINGTLKIYRAQATFVLEDVVKAFTVISVPEFIHLPSRDKTVYFETPPSPIQKKRTKRTPKATVQSTPESQLKQIVEPVLPKSPEINLTDLAVLEARVDEITLRETQLPRQDLGEDFGPLGTGEDIINEIAELAIGSTPQVIAPPRHISKRRKSLLSVTSSISPIQAPITLTVEAQVHAPCDVRSPLHIPPNVEVQEIEQPEQRTVLMEIQKDTVVPKRKIAKNGKTFRVMANMPRLLHIKKCEFKEFDEIEVDSSWLLRSVRVHSLNLTDILKTFMMRDDQSMDLGVRGISPDGSLRGSREGRKRRSSKRATPPIEEIGEGPILAIPEIIEPQRSPITPLKRISEEPIIVIPEIIEPQSSITSLKRRTEESGLKTIEQVLTAGEEIEEMLTPLKRRKLLEPLQASKYLDPIPLELKSAEFVSGTSLQPTLVEDPMPLLDSRDEVSRGKAQQDIVNKVFVDGRVTLEEICQRPINRMNIARAFGDILSLCKFQYVKLVPEEDSIQLKYIEKGAKMFQ